MPTTRGELLSGGWDLLEIGDDVTLYVRWGDWWMSLCGGLLLLAAALAARSRRVSARSTA